MEVILLDKVVNLGGFGDQVNVKAGYARNFLIPQGRAVPANKKNIEYFEARRTELKAKLFNIQLEAETRAKRISEIGNITIQSKVGYEGKLFGSIGARDIANAITIAGINVSKNEVRLPNGALRTVGNHNVNIQVYNNLFATINVVIVPKL